MIAMNLNENTVWLKNSLANLGGGLLDGELHIKLVKSLGAWINRIDQRKILLLEEFW